MIIESITKLMFKPPKMAQKPLTRITTVGKVNGYVEDMLCAGNAKLQKVAEGCGVTAKIAQKGDAIIVNAGPKTGMFSLKEMKHGDEFYTNIINNMKENGAILAKKNLF